jgi:hypothetical protein
MYGLSFGFALKLGASSGLDGLDISRFARLKKLQLREFQPCQGGRAWMGTRPALRVLYMEGLEDAMFAVSIQSSPAPGPLP